MSKSFIEHICQQLLEHSNDLENTLVLTPSKRSSLYITQHLKQTLKGACILPSFKSIEEFATLLLKTEILPSTEFLFKFYSVYQKVNTKEEDFQNFLNWAPTLISDFSDLDGQLIDTQDFFNYCKNYFKMQQWSLEEQTEIQKNYLIFWSKFESYYNLLQDFLKDKPYTYRGQLFKHLYLALKEGSEKVNKQLAEFKKIYFAGFNALTKAEEKIIDLLIKKYNAELIFDFDYSYVNNKNHYAGFFLRKYLKEKSWVQTNKQTHNYFQSKKHIELVSANNERELVRYVWSSYSKKDKSNVLVLANEDHLPVILNEMRDDVEQVNVSLGLSLKNSLIFSFYQEIITNQLFYAKHKRFHIKHLISIFKTFNLIQNQSTSEVLKKLKSLHYLYLDSEQIKQITQSENAVVTHLVQPLKYDIEDYLKALLEIVHNLDQNLNHAIYKEQNFHIQKLFKNITHLTSEYSFLNKPSLLELLFKTYSSEHKIDLIGDAIGELQIMGILETRLLDFESVTLINANEGVFPKFKSDVSFIPYEIKKYFHLPTYKEKEAIFSYHFFRLIQRAKHIKILFLNNNTFDSLGSAEPSRFIHQLKEELKDTEVNIEFKLLQTNETLKPIQPQSIENSDEIKQKLSEVFKEGFSASAITCFLNCPLDFYYKYVLNIRSENEIEEQVSSKAIGNVIHEALFNLYKPFLNRPFDKRVFDNINKNIDQELLKAFKESFQHFSMQDGHFLIQYNLAKKTILSAVKQDLKKSKNTPFKLLALEEKAHRKIDANFIIKGIIDRIEQNGSTIKIVDYKTGHFESRLLKTKSIEQIFEQKNNYAIQLLFYALLTYKEGGNSPSLNIFHLKEPHKHLQSLSIDSENMITIDQLKEFKTALIQSIQSIYNTASFEHNKDSKYCNFCN